MINPGDFKTFKLSDLVGKTITIRSFKDIDNVTDKYSLVTVAVDIDTHVVYVLEIITGLTRCPI